MILRRVVGAARLLIAAVRTDGVRFNATARLLGLVR